ncbi:MAG: glycine--tRNA ligase subunit alpha [Proteobacteria bacterium]|nr:glycine--tRNA ligase subunit alpha [Pseudomonadota bacterium]
MYFQDIILSLQKFWCANGCIMLQPYDIEVGAGTSHPATAIHTLLRKRWNIVYIQPCRRPQDGRYGDSPNRMQHYFQMQVIMKPSPLEAQDLCLESLKAIGIKAPVHDIRFLEDDWKNPTLGAWGLGWEIWCDGMEVVQFTYMQQLGGIDSEIPAVEITYGIERLAMYVQEVESVWDIQWNSEITYSDVFKQREYEYSLYNFQYADIKALRLYFDYLIQEANFLIEKNLPNPAYDCCIKASHTFNLLESRGVISVPERVAYITKIRDVSRACAKISCDIIKNDVLK